MKKLMQLPVAVLCAALLFASCGNTIDADIKKTKGYMCKAVELSEKAQAGDAAAMEEMKKLGEEMEKYMEELKAKYPEGSEDAKKFEAEMQKVMEDPKASCANS